MKPLEMYHLSGRHISAYELCVCLRMTTFCHTLMLVGSTSGGGWANVRSTLSNALVPRSSLRTPRNFMHAQKLSAFADVRPVRSEHAMHMLCERSARPRRGRRTLTERPQNADVRGQKCVNFTTSPLRVGSEFWTFCQRTVGVFSAYAYRIKIDSALVSVFIARSHRMRNERIAYA